MGMQGLRTTVTDTLPFTVAARYPWVQRLDLSGCEGISEAGLTALAVATPRLRELRLRHMHIGALAAGAIRRLGRCERLDLLGCTFATLVASAEAAPEMRTAALAVEGGADQVLHADGIFLGAFSRLVKLELVKASAQNVQDLVHLDTLRELELRHTQVHGVVLGTLVQLRRLELDAVYLHSNSYFPPRPSWNVLVDTLGALQAIEVLELRTVTGANRFRLDDTSCAALGGIRPGLVRLSVCGGSSEVGRRALLAIAEHSGATLHELHLPASTALDGAALGLLASRAPHLRRLGLANCGITDGGIEALAVGCLKLEWLNVSRCAALTEAGVLSLLGRVRLTTLRAFGCHAAITPRVREMLRRHRTRLEYRAPPKNAVTTDAEGRVCPVVVALLTGSLELLRDPYDDIPEPSCTCDRIKCRHCGLMVKVCAEVDHQTVCLAMARPCPLCGDPVDRLALHWAEECPRYAVKCYMCHGTVQRRHLAAHIEAHLPERDGGWRLNLAGCALRVAGCLQCTAHGSGCGSWICACPSCGLPVRRREIEAHRVKCRGPREVALPVLQIRMGTCS